MRRKSLRDLIWRRQRRAVVATLDLLVANGLLTTDLTASGRGRGKELTGRLGGAIISREPFIESVLERVNGVPLSAEEPMTVLTDVELVSFGPGGYIEHIRPQSACPACNPPGRSRG